MYVVLLFALCFVLCVCKQNTENKSSQGSVPDPDVFRNVSELISCKGYPVEEHNVVTGDGYILSMQRIPYGRKSNFFEKKKVILLIHGILASASSWVINFPHQSLGFILADEGFDVWLANNRGNKYSRKHIKYTTDQREFWDFSFDELAKYDTPAMIDYILNATRQTALYCIGHSQGSTQLFAFLSENPKYNEKIRLFTALAPAVVFKYFNNPLRLFLPFTNGIDFMLKIMGSSGEFLYNNFLVKLIRSRFCATEDVFLCEDLMFWMGGEDRSQLNVTRLDVYSAHLIYSTSRKSVLHFSQIALSEKFCKYDYENHNMDYYHQEAPPDYDVSRITTPVALIWSTSDNAIDVKNIDILKRKLKSVVDGYCVPHPLFTHIDFVISIDAKKLVYDHVISILEQY